MLKKGSDKWVWIVTLGAIFTAFIYFVIGIVSYCMR